MSQKLRLPIIGSGTIKFSSKKPIFEFKSTYFTSIMPLIPTTFSSKVANYDLTNVRFVLVTHDFCQRYE